MREEGARQREVEDEALAAMAHLDVQVLDSASSGVREAALELPGAEHLVVEDEGEAVEAAARDALQ